MNCSLIMFNRSLSPVEIKCIRESWAPIYKDPEGNGGLILKTWIKTPNQTKITSFYRFLDKHDYYHKFARFKDAPRDTILENPIFRNHAAKIMHTINDAIANIENTAILKEKLKNLGKGHAKRQIKPVQFEVGSRKTTTKLALIKKFLTGTESRHFGHSEGRGQGVRRSAQRLEKNVWNSLAIYICWTQKMKKSLLNCQNWKVEFSSN